MKFNALMALLPVSTMRRRLRDGRITAALGPRKPAPSAFTLSSDVDDCEPDNVATVHVVVSNSGAQGPDGCDPATRVWRRIRRPKIAFIPTESDR